MSVVVFCGPTIDAAAVRRVLPDADCRPPAGQGDLHAAARGRPAAIALIDGTFLDRPSVWHREILAAIDDGIDVWGAASMGALRAVECEAYGMVGHGKIVTALRAGRYPPFDDAFEDDDEVAVIHGPAELGARQLSEALVDLRETLARAAAAGAIDAATRDDLLARMKALPFAERRFEALVAAATEGLAPEAAAARAGALAAHHCSQKREDAIGLVEALRDPPEAARPRGWSFERTIDWERFAAGAAGPPLSEAERALLDGLAATPGRERALRRRAAARLAALDIAPAPGPLGPALSDFRHDRGLFSRASLDAWAVGAALSPDGLQRLVADEAALDALAARSEPGALARAMLDELRLASGQEGIA